MPRSAAQGSPGPRPGYFTLVEVVLEGSRPALADRVEFREGARRCLACAWLRVRSLTDTSVERSAAA
ncbi:hypothetical protein AB0D59_42045 [Streptomyces sp. NPDC048417]|uniref:hypothetical protein n=1 Tax=Streptomyces sp. NPDC048417 TaxID=3155387 RepID=UPI00342F10F6